MLIPSTITARRIRRYTSTLYIHGTIRRVGYYPMDDGKRHSLQPPNVLMSSESVLANWPAEMSHSLHGECDFDAQRTIETPGSQQPAG